MGTPQVRYPRLRSRIVALALIAGSGAAIASAQDPANSPSPNPFQQALPSGVAHASSGSDCTSCHTIDPTFSHPVGFAPARRLPEQFPLQSGRMTCATCHDVGDSSEHLSAGAQHNPLLRSEIRGSAFCSQCHQSSMSSSSSAHAGIGKAHLLWPDDRAQRATDSVQTRLDEESTSCMECHDGSLATDVGSGTRGLMLATQAQDHPVGIVYMPSEPFSRTGGMNRLIQPEGLDHRVRLFDGTVGCGSCHSVYSPIKNHLVMSNDGSRLCLSCHNTNGR